MKLAVKTIIWSVPFWILLVVENYFLPAGGVDQILRWINFPGMYMMITIFPKWRSIHNAEPYIYFIANCIIYCGFVFLILFICSKVKAIKAK